MPTADPDGLIWAVRSVGTTLRGMRQVGFGQPGYDAIRTIDPELLLVRGTTTRKWKSVSGAGKQGCEGLRLRYIFGYGEPTRRSVVSITDQGETVSDSTPTDDTPVAPARILRLTDRVEDDLSDSTTAAERFAMVALLSERMWELTGRPVPSYSRAEIPARVVRLK